MKKSINFFNLYCTIGVIVISAIARILPHPPNLAPITALALFSGAYIDKRWGFVLPISAMLLSDLFLGLHPTLIFVYAAFIVIYLLGRSLSQASPLRLALITVLSSTLFFLITNFGVWALFDFYPKTISGLLECYITGIPFFRNTLIGDIVFTGVFFFGYRLIYRIFTELFPKKYHI
jgi:hypothetical protein